MKVLTSLGKMQQSYPTLSPFPPLPFPESLFVDHRGLASRAQVHRLAHDGEDVAGREDVVVPWS